MPTTYVNFGLGVACGVQANIGTANATIAGLTGSLSIASGIILGDPSGGAGETGIGLTVTREERDAVNVTGSFTRQPGAFLSESGKLTIICALRGAGNPATAGTPVDSDMNLSLKYPGLDALLRMSGLVGTEIATAATGYQYIPATAQPGTIKVWEGESLATTGNAWVFMDCFASFSIDFTPGDVPIITFTIAPGSVYSFTSNLTVPQFTYGTVASESPPIVKNAGNVWGPSDPRGFWELSVDIDSQLEDTPDSNAVNGKTTRQTGRSVNVKGSFYTEDSDTDFERSKLVGTTAPTEDIVFTVVKPDGTGAAVASGPVLAFTLSLNNVVVTSDEPAKSGPNLGHTIEGYCTATAINAEMALTFI